MKRITTASALRALANKILEATKSNEADEAYHVNLDKLLDEVENS